MKKLRINITILLFYGLCFNMLHRQEFIAAAILLLAAALLDVLSDD